MTSMIQLWQSMWVTPAVYWELVVTAVALILAGLVKFTVNSQLPVQHLRWQLAAEALQRVFFPVIGLFGVFVGAGVLTKLGFSVLLLKHFVLPLLSAMALIRLLVYLLRYIFEDGTWITRSEKLVFWTVWVGFVLHLTGLLPELVQVLDDLSFSVGKHKFTVLLLINGLLSLVAILLVTLWLSSLLEKRLMLSEALDLNLRVVLTRVARTLLVVLGLLITLPVIGIDLTALSVFSGALGVGIGFGLQKIASNYVSGFIILLDRSIRIGDTIRVGDRQGIVQQLTSRYAVVSSGPGSPATIIPTDTLITSTVVNLTYSEQRINITMPVRIAYESNLEVAEKCLLDAAHAEIRVLQEPAPLVFVKNFGESGIDLELSYWIADPENGESRLRSDINRGIWTRFIRENIEIPYPKRQMIPASNPVAVPPVSLE